jgi:glutamate-1-semialdehyde 2,1-aminomutase
MNKRFDLEGSLAWSLKAESLIPGGTSTLAKSHSRMFPPATPRFAVRAQGAYFEDIEGQKWLDCDMALGTVVWGHCNREINLSIMRQIRLGCNFSLPSRLEAMAAEKILNRLRSFSSLRFCKTGADAVSAAIRIARAHTGRRRILAGTYHGWHDWSAYNHYDRSSKLGIPDSIGKLTVWLKEESIQEIKRVLDVYNDIAAVVVCPEHWEKEDLQKIVAICKSKFIMVIFDEIKSSLRFGRRGVAGAVGVCPDLLCLGKGLANGLPIAAIVGPREIMALCNDVRLTSTYATENLSLAATDAAEDLLMAQSHWPPWKERAEALMHALNEEIESHNLTGQLIVSGYYGCFHIGSASKLKIEDPFRKHFILTLARDNIFSSGYILLSAAHKPTHINRIEKAARASIRAWKNINTKGDRSCTTC